MPFTMQQYGEFVTRRPFLVIVLSLLLAMASLAGGQHLRFTNDYRYFFSNENPYLTAFEELERTYSSPDTIFYVYQPKDGSDATSNEALKLAYELTEAGWQVPYSTRVDSLTNFQNTRAIGEDDLEVRALVPDVTDIDDKRIGYVEDTILNEPLLAGRLLSQDKKTAAVLVSLRPPRDDVVATNDIVIKARAIHEEMRAKYPNIRIELTGSQMLSNAFAEAAQGDLTTLTPTMFVIIALVLIATTRKLFATFAAMIVVTLSAGMAMGTGGWLGMPLSPPASGAPTIILTVAVADCVHILITALVAQGQGKSKREAIIESLNINAQAVFLTSVTTAIGLFSLNFSDAPPYRDLGTFAGIGSIYAWILSMSLFPALLVLLPMRASTAVDRQSRSMEWLANMVIAKRRPLMLAMLAVTFIGAALLPRLTFNDRFVEYFDERVDFRQASDWAADNLTGIYIINYSLPSPDVGGVSDPDYLQDLDAFTQWLRAQPEVVHVASFSDVVKRINRSFNGDRDAFYAVPENRELAAQYVLLYEMSLPYGLDLNDQLNVDKSASRMVVTLDDLSTAEMKALRARALDWLAANTPERMHVEASGQAVMFSYIGERNFSAMTVGTLVAFILISGCLMLALRSLRLGLISLVPNIAPPAVAMGFFSLYTHEVGFWTAFVGATAIGLIVDATVHMLSKYRHARFDLNYSSIESVRYSFRMVGTALWVCSFVLIAGFMVLTLSPFLINDMLGRVVALTILTALVLDFLLLPALLMWIDGRGDPHAPMRRDENADAPLAQPAE
ncbi:MAG: Siderophore exporter MmpL5 [Alphaproteobacteria bacterium]|nr:MAG: Siderophore exporter MmpL5 [Alphaproteobacteria bacterium]